jgi:hypothetical protein
MDASIRFSNLFLTQNLNSSYFFSGRLFAESTSLRRILMNLLRNVLKNIGLLDTIIHHAEGRIAMPLTVPTSRANSTKGLDSFELFSPEKLKALDPGDVLKSGKIHPELKKRTEQLLFEAERQGLRPQIVAGFRSLESQKKLYESGRKVTNAKAGDSFHNYGLAVDIAFRDDKNKPSWDEKHDWEKLGKIGKSVGLQWGGDWKKRDRPHFQLLPQNQLSRVKSLNRSLGIEKMWKDAL